jgi:hypothetical protein
VITQCARMIPTVPLAPVIIACVSSVNLQVPVLFVMVILVPKTLTVFQIPVMMELASSVLLPKARASTCTVMEICAHQVLTATQTLVLEVCVYTVMVIAMVILVLSITAVFRVLVTKDPVLNAPIPKLVNIAITQYVHRTQTV